MPSPPSFSFSGTLVLAPLAGYTDLAFRLLCRQHGATLCVSEMISSHGLVYRQPATEALLATSAEDRPVAFQLFGADAAVMGEAARLLQPFAPDLIDINMGCPVKKVTKRGAGAALMADPRLAESIIRAVVANSRCPVTVKFRSGPDAATITAVDFARMAEQAGAAALTVHGRTWKQGFCGTADWTIVRQVKEAVTIPVIGNGDVSDYHDAEMKRLASGCDAVMIGRAALGNPWVFSATGRPDRPADILAAGRHHLHLMNIHGLTRLGSAKNHLGRYFKGFPGASRLRAELYQIADWPHLLSFFDAALSRFADVETFRNH